jgi:hypothetical protein
MTVLPPPHENAADTPARIVRPPRYAMRLIDANTLEFDWLFSEEAGAEIPESVDSDHFTFGGALWRVFVFRSDDNRNARVDLEQIESVHSTIVIAFSRTIIHHRVDAAPLILADKNHVFAIGDDDLTECDKLFSRTRFDMCLQDSNALLLRFRIRLANGNFHYYN